MLKIKNIFLFIWCYRNTLIHLYKLRIMGRPALPKEKKKEVYTYRALVKVKEKADKKAKKLNTSVSEKIQEWIEDWVIEK